jgi:hypothetical protein
MKHRFKTAVLVLGSKIGRTINNNGCLEGVSRKLLVNYTPLPVGTRFYSSVVQRVGSALEKHMASLPKQMPGTDLYQRFER